jgi:cytochrome b subunit of formate dehydrogenase
MAGDLRRLRGDRDKKSVPHCIVHACMNGLFFLTTELHRSFSSYITFTSLLHHSFSSYVTFTSVPSSVPFVHHPLPERADSGFSGCAGKVSQLRNKLPARSPFQARRKILFFGVWFEFRLKPDARQPAA